MPTIVISGNTGSDYSGCIDNQIDNNNPGTNNGLAGDCAVGNFFGGEYIWNMLLSFTGLSNIPSGATISASTVSLYRQNGMGIDPETIVLHQLRRNWSETESTYQSYTTGNNWGTAGAFNTTSDIYSANLCSADVAETDGYKNFTAQGLIDFVQGVSGGTISNYGYNLIMTYTGDGYKIFTTTQGADGQRPSQSVTYTEGGGVSIPVIINNMRQQGVM